MSDTNNTFPCLIDAINALHIAKSQLAMTAELFGHDLEGGKYPTLMGAETRIGVWYTLKQIGDIMEKTVATFEAQKILCAVPGDAGAGVSV